VRRFGASRLTLVSVAEEAGMTHANIYRYFASKLALCDALTADWMREVEGRLGAVVDSPDPADDKLERLLLELMRVHRRHLASEPELYALLINAYAENRLVARQHRARVGVRVLLRFEIGLGVGNLYLAVGNLCLGLLQLLLCLLYCCCVCRSQHRDLLLRIRRLHIITSVGVRVYVRAVCLCVRACVCVRVWEYVRVVWCVSCL
jgi:hypothetical protein